MDQVGYVGYINVYIMNNYIKIQTITFGNLQEKQANAITWTVGPIMRGATSAIAYCGLIWINQDESSIQIDTFQVELDNATLQAWGSDDTVIDDAIINYSPLFVKV